MMTMMCPERSLCRSLLAAVFFGPVEDRDDTLDGDSLVIFSPVREDGSFVASVSPVGDLWAADLMVDTGIVWASVEPSMQEAFIALAGATTALLRTGH
ncbi:hypothetical protein C0V97_12555 [Asaia sp. W19]|uniref:hypothetical protein n=1 Tax=unclassified Asaia TaxID=2685023 RepID=UPI000F8DF4FE|nr:hypothetical protein [Asaia sp. W19]RUT25406.1 hypothetical protein C0V97_12555 [Asaia sp. W19]